METKFKGMLSAVGDCMVLEIGMVGSYKSAIEFGPALRKDKKPYWELKKALKKQILSDLEDLFGGDYPSHEDGFIWDKQLPNKTNE